MKIKKQPPAGTEVEASAKKQKQSIFQGLSFNSKAVSLKEYIENYNDYVKRCVKN